MYMYMYMCRNMRMHACIKDVLYIIYTYMYMCTYVYMHIHVYVYVCICTSILIYMYRYVHIHTDYTCIYTYVHKEVLRGPCHSIGQVNAGCRRLSGVGFTPVEKMSDMQLCARLKRRPSSHFGRRRS